MIDIFDAINRQIVAISQNLRNMSYEYAPDVDRHDDNAKELTKQLKILRDIRAQIEDLL